MDSNKRYKDSLSEDQRKSECENIRKNYPDKIPLIIEKHPKSKLEQIDRTKFLILEKLRVYQVNTIIRRKMSLNKVDALYLFVNDNILLRGDQCLKDVYEKYKDSDGFIYLSYCEYSSFGKNV
ncbi:hypothetical protein ABPG74_021546 [Tetrahymena malaccensis]